MPRHSYSKDEAIKRLLAALSNELITSYYYFVTAYSLRGPLSEELREMFLEEAKEELEVHAKKIADRLWTLGAVPPSDFKSLWELSTCKYPELPGDPYDLDGWLIAAIRAEECAIKQYEELIQLTMHEDPVTENLATELLHDEMEHLAMLKSMLSKEGLKRL